jgi:hypothetical protein
MLSRRTMRWPGRILPERAGRPFPARRPSGREGSIRLARNSYLAIIPGQCLCGAFRFEIDGPIGEVHLCHCDQCRRAKARQRRTLCFRRHRWTRPGEASSLYIDALTRDTPDLSKTIKLYALISRMRVVSSSKVIEEALKVGQLIVASYTEPNKSFEEIRAMASERALDPLCAFSEACREELQQLKSL